MATTNPGMKQRLASHQLQTVDNHCSMLVIRRTPFSGASKQVCLWRILDVVTRADRFFSSVFFLSLAKVCLSLCCWRPDDCQAALLLLWVLWWLCNNYSPILYIASKSHPSLSLSLSSCVYYVHTFHCRKVWHPGWLMHMRWEFDAQIQNTWAMHEGKKVHLIIHTPCKVSPCMQASTLQVSQCASSLWQCISFLFPSLDFLRANTKKELQSECRL
jgi:hypothetical protein